MGLRLFASWCACVSVIVIFDAAEAGASPPPEGGSAPTADDAPAASGGGGYGYDGGFFLRTADRRYSMKVNGFAQLLYTGTIVEGDYANTFDLGLGRLAFSGEVFDPSLSYFFQIEGSTFGDHNGIGMLDWWMRYSVSPYLYVLAGRHILPYSRQFYTHPGNLLFADLSSADYAFNMPRVIGAQIGGSAGPVTYDVFVNNSVLALDNSTQHNRGEGIAAGARLEVAILEPYGYMESVPSGDAPASLSVGVAAAYNEVAEDSGFQNVAKGDDTLNVTADAGFRFKRLSLQGAFYQRRKLNNEEGNNIGYYGQAGCVLLPDHVELTARYSGVHFDSRIPQADGAAALGAPGSPTEITGGLNLYLFGHVAKLQLDYTFVKTDLFEGGDSTAHRFRVQSQVLF